MDKIYDIISAKEKQATLKAAFVFLAVQAVCLNIFTSKQTAKQDEKRRMRGLASFYDIMFAKAMRRAKMQDDKSLP